MPQKRWHRTNPYSSVLQRAVTVSRLQMPEESSSQFIFQWKDVHKEFPGVIALNGVSIALNAGQVHAIVGENGAGKSTLIKLAAGVYQPDGGSVVLDGQQSIHNPVEAYRNGIVTVFQESELFDQLSVAENMALLKGLPCKRIGVVDWQQIKQSSRHQLRNLPEKLDPTVNAVQLSVAQRQMLQVAAAVSENAKVLILDEPTSALSAKESQWLFEQIKTLRAQGCAIVYISHRQNEIFELADVISVLRDGELIWTKDRSEVTSESLVTAMVGRPVDIESHRDLHKPSNTLMFRAHQVSDGNVLNGIDLDINAGEIVGLYGLIGSGRTEFAETVFGIRKQFSGAIYIDGDAVEIRKPRGAVRHGLAYLSEDRLNKGVFRWLDIRENTVVASLRQISKVLTSRRDELTATTEMGNKLNTRYASHRQPIETLSGGNQQKVVAGRWLLTKPKVLILDEPTRGVDVGAKEEIHDIIQSLAESGCAILLISSELNEVMRYCHRIIVFRDGDVAGEVDATDAKSSDVAELAFPKDSTVELTDDPDANRPSRRRSGWRALLRTESALAAMIVILLILLKVQQPDYQISVLLDASATWMILGLAAAIVIIVGGIDISIGSLAALSAACGGLVLQTDLPPSVSIPLAMIVAMSVGAAGGLVNSALSLWGNVHPIVVTLGMLYAYRGLVSTIMDGKNISNLPDGFGNLAIVDGFYTSVIYGLVISAFGFLLLHHCRCGRHFYAVGNSPTAANLLGIRKSKNWFYAFAIGGALVGLAGMLQLAQKEQMQATLGRNWELEAIAVAVIGGVSINGGKGSAIGVILAAILVQTFSAVLIKFGVPGDRMKLVIGLMILVAVFMDHLWNRQRSVRSTGGGA